MNQAKLSRRQVNRAFGHLGVLAATGLLLSACQEQRPEAAASRADSPGGTAPGAASAEAAGVSAAQRAYERAQGTQGFAVGALMAAHTVYVFFDPACPHCAELWTASKPLWGKLKMVWIPVALLGKSSGPLGATILSAADPAAAMAQHEAALMARQQGIAVNAAAGPEALAKVQANTEVFRQLQADSVPLLVFKNARTGAYGSNAGALQTAELAALTGV